LSRSRLDGALQLVYVQGAAGAPAALGAAGSRLAKKSPPKDAPHVKSRRYEEDSNQAVLNFDGGESKQKHDE
jgi:hypothetical protein